MKTVLKVTQSPLNLVRWLVVLDCGHENWVNRRKRPTANTMRCPQCEWESTERVQDYWKKERTAR